MNRGRVAAERLVAPQNERQCVGLPARSPFPKAIIRRGVARRNVRSAPAAVSRFRLDHATALNRKPMTTRLGRQAGLRGTKYRQRVLALPFCLLSGTTNLFRI